MTMQKIRQFKIQILLAGLTIFVVCTPHFSWAAPTFGAEFNFSNDVVRSGQKDGFTVNSDASEAARDALMKQVLQVCGECRSITEENAYGVTTYKIVYPDGWFFVIATDPSVVEIQTKPSTAEEIEHRLGRIQKDVFESARAVGLKPSTQSMSPSWAGAHIHVGTSSALGGGRDAVRLLRDFMVDFSNHPELAMGIFTNDHMNAPPLAKLPAEQIEALRQIVADVDQGKIRSINTFAKRVRNEVYNVTVREDLNPTTKYHAFNVNRIGSRHFDVDEQTFELRAMRGQESALDFLIEVRLVEARLAYLARKTTPVEVDLPPLNMTEEQKAEGFYRYVTESGLDFAPYEKFLNYTQKAFLPGIKTRIQAALLCRVVHR